MKERLMYLDVDDTLLIHTRDVRGFPAPLAAEFLHWALEHFEVRWLTMWCPPGKLDEYGAAELTYRFDNLVTLETFLAIQNPKSFTVNKTEGVDFDDPRPWVWVDDGMMANEWREMSNRGKLDNFYKTNVSHNSVALQATWKALAEKFNLPGAPTYPYETKSHLPLQHDMAMEELMRKFRPLENTAWPK